MDAAIKEKLAASLDGFRLPRYDQLPDVGLYLEQTVQIINEYLSPLQEGDLTPSMVSNYVKKGLVENPHRKRYSREQIAYLIFITLAKNLLSLDDLHRFIGLQKRSYPARVAYDYLCEELENMLGYVFGLKEAPAQVGVDSTEEKFMLRATIVAISHKIYLEKCFRYLSKGEEAHIPGED